MNEEIPHDWHRAFFTGLWLDVQRDSFDGDQTRELVDAAQEALQLLPPARVLDVPCGEGRVAVEFASRGFAVTGVERSEELLAEARARADRRSVDVEWQQGDMWELGDFEPFDAAVCLWSSIGYGSQEQDAHLFASLARLTTAEGAILIETHVLETLLPLWESTQWRWAGKIGVGETRSFDHETGRLCTEWVLAGPDRRETRSSSLRIYSYRELTQLVRAAGFEAIEAFGSPDLEPFELGSSCLILLARKVAPGDED